MANETVELYYKGKPINPNRDLPTRTYAEAQAEGLTSSDKLWVRKDGDGTIITADQVPYDSNNSVKDKIDSMDSYGNFALNNGVDYSSYIDTKWGAAAQKKGNIGLISLSVRFKNVSAASVGKTLFEFPSGAIIPSMTYSVNVVTTTNKVFTLIISSSGVQIQNPPALTTADILACNIPYL